MQPRQILSTAIHLMPGGIPITLVPGTKQTKKSLYHGLKTTKARFILSTWHSNEHRDNPAISTLWSEFNVITREHFYHVGAKESNRKPMLEALVTNFEPAPEPRKTASEGKTYAADALQLKFLEQKGQSKYTPGDSFSEKTD